MSIRHLWISLFILLSSSIYGEELNKKEILDSMVYPAPELEIGSLVNDPFFSLNIHDDIINIKEIKKSILLIEKRINDKSDPSEYFALGNYYKDLMDYENAIKYYNMFLISVNSESVDKQTTLILGEIYYNLIFIDINSKKPAYLEKASLYLFKSSDFYPDNVNLWIKLGDCYLASDKTADALYCYGKASEKKLKDPFIIGRLYAASFQRDYLKLKGKTPEMFNPNIDIMDGFDFSDLQKLFNNAPDILKDSFKIQYYIYHIRLLLYKKNRTPELNPSFNIEEKKILTEADKFIKSIKNRNINKIKLGYVSGIISYIMSDYRNSVSSLKTFIKETRYSNSVSDDILFIYLNCLKDSDEAKYFANSSIGVRPSAEYYFILSSIEFSRMNLTGAEFYCNQALKINYKLPYLYSALSVIYAYKENYFSADEMIKKASMLEQNIKYEKNNLYCQMKINEAAIALFKNEKERAYLLLRSVLTVDNNVNASRLYNRYFLKNE